MIVALHEQALSQVAGRMANTPSRSPSDAFVKFHEEKYRLMQPAVGGTIRNYLNSAHHVGLREMTSLDDEIEIAFIRAFIENRSQNRWKTQRIAPIKRQKLLNRLYHNPGIIKKYMVKIPDGKQSSDEIFKMLKSFGAPLNCYVISAHKDIDGKILSLRTALNEVVGFRDGSVICSIANRLAYWEGSELRARYILTKRSLEGMQA